MHIRNEKILLKARALVLLCACQLPAQQYLAMPLTGGGVPLTPFAPLNAPVTPSGVAVDSAGRAFFIAGNCVYKLDATGAISLVAGTGIAGFSGDGGPASKAELDLRG